MKYFLLLFFILFTKSYSQSTIDTLNINYLKEIFINSKNLKKSKIFISQKTEVINSKEIEFQNFQNSADILSNSGTAYVQKSQQGGGSPVIRGFEASRVLLLVDGIRMNNLIFRSGHLQNIISVDENILSNVEVFYGSSSTLFGSDALGGAINLYTKKPKFSDNNNTITGTFSSRYSSVNNEKSGHVSINFGQQNFASLTSLSYNDFDDLKMGKKQNGKNAFFGERLYYVENINGLDQQVLNSNKYLQKYTGYKQYDLMQKFVFKSKKDNIHSLNFQFSTTSNIPRYDRLTDENNNGLINSEWFYGPQKRLLGVYSFEKKKLIFDSDFVLNIAYQNVIESRHNRRFNNVNLQNRIENVSVYSFDFTLNKKYSKSDLVYGVECYNDYLISTAYSKNIFNGNQFNIDSRYPNGKNNMLRTDAFIYLNNSISNKTSWNIGSRIGYSNLYSTISDNSFFELPFTEIHQKNLTYSGTVGFIQKPSSQISLIANINSAFRIPNIDDLAKIFENSVGTIIVPNSNLKPEKTITTDLGIRVNSVSKRFEFEINYYYTRFIDAIVTDKFNYNGLSQIVYNGTTSVVLANQNKGEAFVMGLFAKFNWFIDKNLNFNGNYNYTLGRIIEEGGVYSPLDHIAPSFGKISLNYLKSKYGFELYLLYNGSKNINEFLLNGEDNEQYAPVNGMPSWKTFNFKSSFSINKNTSLFFGIENIFDIQYRTFASGMNAPGRNVYSSFKINF